MSICDCITNPRFGGNGRDATGHYSDCKLRSRFEGSQVKTGNELLDNIDKFCEQRDIEEGYKYKDHGFVMISHNNPFMFEWRVNKYLKAGFKLHGHNSFVAYPESRTEFFYQAVVKEL